MGLSSKKDRREEIEKGRKGRGNSPKVKVSTINTVCMSGTHSTNSSILKPFKRNVSSLQIVLKRRFKGLMKWWIMCDWNDAQLVLSLNVSATAYHYCC